jgi:tetratricopeptide (TPR) repeat protein
MGEGNSLLEQSLAIYRELGNKIGQANTLEWLTVNNSPERAMRFAKECLAIHRGLGNLSGIAVCLNLLTLLSIRSGDFSSTNLWLEEALSLSRRIGHQTTECYTLTFFGDAAFWHGEYEQANSYYREAILLAERIGDHYQIFWIEIRMAYAVFRQGEIQQARKMFIKSIRDTQQADLIIALVFAVEGLASLHASLGQPERAIRLLAWADATRKTVGNLRPPVEQADVDKDFTGCLEKLGEIAFSDAYEEGKELSVEEAIAEAVEE